MTTFLIIAFIFLAIYFLRRGDRSSGSKTRRAGSNNAIRAFSKQVHGIFHKNSDGSSRQKIIRESREGEEVDLVAEPDNPVDPDAIMIVRKNGDQLGYWPSDDGGRWAGELKRGRRCRVTIDEIYEFDDKPGKYGVKLLVEVLQ